MSMDKELVAMGSVLSAMEPLDADERKRVLAWVAEKFGVESAPVRAKGNTLGSSSAVASGEKFDLTTDTIATITNAGSGPDLVMAAAAQLHFVAGKPKFGRQDLTSEMRTAPAHFKESFVNNLTKYLAGLTKADRLRLVGKDTYALSNKSRQELEASLANA